MCLLPPLKPSPTLTLTLSPPLWETSICHQMRGVAFRIHTPPCANIHAYKKNKHVRVMRYVFCVMRYAFGYTYVCSLFGMFGHPDSDEVIFFQQLSLPLIGALATHGISISA